MIGMLGFIGCNVCFLIDQSSAATSEYYSDNEATQEAVEVILDFVLYTRYICYDIVFLFLFVSFRIPEDKITRP